MRKRRKHGYASKGRSKGVKKEGGKKGKVGRIVIKTRLNRSGVHKQKTGGGGFCTIQKKKKTEGGFWCGSKRGLIDPN